MIWLVIVLWSIDWNVFCTNCYNKLSDNLSVKSNGPCLGGGHAFPNILVGRRQKVLCPRLSEIPKAFARPKALFSHACLFMQC